VPVTPPVTSRRTVTSIRACNSRCPAATCGTPALRISGKTRRRCKMSDRSRCTICKAARRAYTAEAARAAPGLRIPKATCAGRRSRIVRNPLRAPVCRRRICCANGQPIAVRRQWAALARFRRRCLFPSSGWRGSRSARSGATIGKRACPLQRHRERRCGVQIEVVLSTVRTFIRGAFSVGGFARALSGVAVLAKLG